MPAIKRLSPEDCEFKTSPGSITRPCSDHTTTHKSFKTEKNIYFMLLKKFFFYLFQDKMNILASKFQAARGQPSLGILVWDICILGT